METTFTAPDPDWPPSTSWPLRCPRLARFIALVTLAKQADLTLSCNEHIYIHIEYVCIHGYKTMENFRCGQGL